MHEHIHSRLKKMVVFSTLCYNPLTHSADWQGALGCFVVGVVLGGSAVYATQTDHSQEIINEGEMLLNKAAGIEISHFNTSPSILQATLCSEFTNPVALATTQERLLSAQTHATALLHQMHNATTRSVSAEHMSKYALQRSALQKEMRRLSEFEQHLNNLAATYTAFNDTCIKPAQELRLLKQKSSDTFGSMLALMAGDKKFDTSHLVTQISALHARHVFQGVVKHNHPLVACVHTLEQTIDTYRDTLGRLAHTACNNATLIADKEAARQDLKELQQLRTTITQLPSYHKEKEDYLQGLAAKRAAKLAEEQARAQISANQKEAARYEKERAEAAARVAEATAQSVTAEAHKQQIAADWHHRPCNTTIQQQREDLAAQRRSLNTAQEKIEAKERALVQKSKLIAEQSATISHYEEQITILKANVQNLLGRLHQHDLNMSDLQSKVNELQAVVQEYKTCNGKILPWIEQVLNQITRLYDERHEEEGFPNAEFTTLMKQLQNIRDTLRATPAKDADIKR